MPYALVVYFNIESEKPIRNLWERIADAGINSSFLDSGIRPHMTLSVFDKIECLPCENELSIFAQRTQVLNLDASHFGIFTNPHLVVFIAPTPTRDLILFHQRIVESIIPDPSLTRKMYQPGAWIPHCTVALDFEQENLSKVMKLCLELPLPFKLQPAQVGVVEFQPIKPLFDFDLKSD